MSAATGPRPGAGRSALRTALVILAACAAVYFTGLSVRGFADSEGHRVGPGWEMLRSGDWLVTRLFEQAYFRKPPGMPWAVAVSSMVLGETELAARAVSAASTALIALGAAFFAGRWFGPRAALPAGLAAALWPMMVAPGRTAEIEALNHLFTAAATWLAIELLVHRAADERRAGAARRAGVAVALGVAVTGVGLAKGPAGLPPVGAALVVGLLVRVLLRRRGGWGTDAALVAIALALPAAAWLLLAEAVRGALVRGGEVPVLQGVSEFLWGQRVTLEKLGEVAAMPVVALLSALPVSLVVLLPLLWRARRGGGPVLARPASGPMLTALVLMIATGAGLLVLTALGVHNPRYAMPCLVPMPVLAGLAWTLLPGTAGVRRAGAIAAGALLAVCVGLGPVRDALRSPTNSGRLAARALAEALPDGAEVWANDMVEARPELLLYARQNAAAAGKTVRPRWVPALELPPAGTFVLLRTDERSGEMGLVRALGWEGRLTPVHSGRVHVFDFTLFRVGP